MPYVKHKTNGSVMEVTDVRMWCEPHMGYETMPAAAGRAAHKTQAIERLRGMLNPGDVVYTVLRHASASGMSRRIDLYAIREDRPVYLSGYAAVAIGERIGKERGIIVKGCGMDMGFDLVYRLGEALWPHETPEPYGTRNGAPDTAGGYALKHEWL